MYTSYTNHQTPITKCACTRTYTPHLACQLGGLPFFFASARVYCVKYVTGKGKRRIQYEDLARDGQSCDVWFDYTRPEDRTLFRTCK
jgi:hypothetical protein